MSDDLWVTIPNWEQFQHYKDRDPVWIKVYTELNSRDDWLELTDAERGLLALLWVEFARSNGRLRISNVPARERQKGRKRAFERLSKAGFIQLSASPPARGRAREETEKSREEPLTPRSGATPRDLKINPRALGTNPRAAAERTRPLRNAERWIENGLAAQIPPERLSDVIAEEFGIKDPAQLDELVTKAKAQ